MSSLRPSAANRSPNAPDWRRIIGTSIGALCLTTLAASAQASPTASQGASASISTSVTHHLQPAWSGQARTAASWEQIRAGLRGAEQPAESATSRIEQWQQAEAQGVPQEAIRRAISQAHRAAEMAGLHGTHGTAAPGLFAPGDADPKDADPKNADPKDADPTQAATTPALPPSYYTGKMNTLHMDVRAVVDPESGQMRVDSTLYMESTSTDNEDQLRFNIPDFEILAVMDGQGTELEHELKFGQLVVVPARGYVAPEETFEVRVLAEGKPTCTGGGLRACSFGSSLNYVTHADYFPRNALSGLDLFTADLRVTVPAVWTVAGTGQFVDEYDPATVGDGDSLGTGPPGQDDGEVDGEIEGEGGEAPVLAEPQRRTFHYSHAYETVWLSFAMAEYDVVEDATEEPPLALYVRPTEAWNSDTLFSIARSVIGLYSRVFSPFPFDGLDIVQINNNFGGGYGPQATIMMSANIFEIAANGWYYASLVQLESHEIAHQWWGNYVFIGDNVSVSLSEGLAEFSSALHYEMEQGSIGNFVENGMTYIYTVPPLEDTPVASPFIFSSNYYQTLAYDKASVVFNMLRHHLGEDVFFDGMALYTDLYGRGAATMSDFWEVMEAASGRDLDSFFDRWMYSAGYPTLVVSTSQPARSSDGSYTVEVELRQTNVDEPYPLRVELFFDLADDEGTRVERVVRFEGESLRTTFRLSAPLARLHVDPNRILLQRTYADLVGDVTLDGEIDGLDLIDMARRYQRNIVYDWNGNSYFYPNGGYLPRFDLNRDGLIDLSDVDILVTGQVPALPSTE